MKVVILAGGLGSRLAEETEVKPKPMVEVGERPILWHILKHYSYYGFNEFFVALGYKGEIIKRYFLDYSVLNQNLKVDLSTGICNPVGNILEDWIVHLIDTGQSTMTGGRLKRLEPWLQSETFMLTYGDGVSNIDLHKLLGFHNFHKKIATITAVRPPARFGEIVLDEDFVSRFSEKSQVGEGWINGGYMVFQPKIFNYLKDDQSILEVDALEQLVAEGQLVAYRHYDFWQCMDTLRDKRLLERLWLEEQAPWKLWK